MRILLDENLPLALHRALLARGHECQHIIDSGERGLPDSEIRRRLAKDALLLVTQDKEFLELPLGTRGSVLVSRLRQNRRIADRVGVWVEAIEQLLRDPRHPAVFELADDGELTGP